jgi:hypothetical protein
MGDSTITSMGSEISRPNIMRLGVHKVLYTDALYAAVKYGRWSSQSLWFFIHKHCQHLLRCPVETFYHAVRFWSVRRCISSTLHNSANKCDSNSRPWSVWIRKDVPYLQINSVTSFFSYCLFSMHEQCVCLGPFTEIISDNHYRSPFSVTGRGPIMSIAMASSGADTSTCFIANHRRFSDPRAWFPFLTKHTVLTPSSNVTRHASPANKIAIESSVKSFLDLDGQRVCYCVTESLFFPDWFWDY